MTQYKTCTRAIIICALTGFAHISLAIPSFSLSIWQEPGIEKFEHPRVVTVEEGDTFSINLRSQAGTGYTWYITEPLFYDCVTLLNKTDEIYRCPGGNGKTIFTFQALRPGTETIKFEYVRSWSWHAAQTRTYHIIIKEKKQTLNPTVTCVCNCKPYSKPPRFALE